MKNIFSKINLSCRLQRPLRYQIQQRRCFSALEDMILEKKAFAITMPEIMSATEGKIVRWLKEAGDNFEAGEPICEINTAGLTIEFEIPQSGVLIEKVAFESQPTPVNKPIAYAAISKAAYLDYIDHQRIDALDAVKQAEVEEIKTEEAEVKSSERKVDNLMVMRELKHMIRENKIQDGTDLAKELQALARRGDETLLAVFEASFDGSAFSREKFDYDFFLDNAKAIYEERKQKQP